MFLVAPHCWHSCKNCKSTDDFIKLHEPFDHFTDDPVALAKTIEKLKLINSPVQHCSQRGVLDKEEKHKDCFGGCRAKSQIFRNDAAQHHALEKKSWKIRAQVYSLFDLGYTNEEIAKGVNRSIRTISGYRRERNLGVK